MLYESMLTFSLVSFSSIQVLNLATSTYTPGIPFSPHPIPQATIPVCTYRPGFFASGQTRGLPPSPYRKIEIFNYLHFNQKKTLTVHVSLPDSPPAHIKLGCKLKAAPNLVFLKDF